MLTAALYGMTTRLWPPGERARARRSRTSRVADVQRFYKEHWNPAAMTLVVVGDVDPRRCKAKLDAGLGAWKPAGAKKPAPARARSRRRSTQRLLARRSPGAAQSDVRIGLVGPDRKDPRYYAFEVLRSTLGGSFTSRLIQPSARAARYHVRRARRHGLAPRARPVRDLAPRSSRRRPGRASRRR